MAYTKQTWTNGAGGGTPLSAARLQHIEDGLETAAGVADSADGGDVAGETHAATGKTTPVDADELPIVDSAASNVLKKSTWANVKATLKTYFDTLYLNQDTTGSAAKWTTARTVRTDLASTTAVSVDGTANVTPGVTGILPLANGGTGASLTDPDGDRILFWDDSVGAVGFLTPSTNLTISGTNMTAAGSGSGGDASTNTATSVVSEVVLFADTAGKTLKRATGSGLAKLTSGVLGTATAGTDYLAPSGSAASLTGFPTLNQSTTGSAATLTTGRTVQTNLASTSSASFNGSANITPGVTGTLPVGNGGTGAATLTGIVKGTGTTAMVAATAETDYVTPTGTGTISGKRITPRTGGTTSSATPTINTDNVDVYGLTALAADITSFTTNLSGTPTDGQQLLIYVVGTATRAIAWGTSFENGAQALPAATVGTARLDVAFIWNPATSKWRCMGSTSLANRVTTITSSATPAINTDLCDAVTITALAAAITSMTSGLTGTPTNFQKLMIRIKDNGTLRAISWGASFEDGTVALPTTTAAGKTLLVGLVYDAVDAKWACEATGSRA